MVYDNLMWIASREAAEELPAIAVGEEDQCL